MVLRDAMLLSYVPTRRVRQRSSQNVCCETLFAGVRMRALTAPLAAMRCSFIVAVCCNAKPPFVREMTLNYVPPMEIYSECCHYMLVYYIIINI